MSDIKLGQLYQEEIPLRDSLDEPITGLVAANVQILTTIDGVPASKTINFNEVDAATRPGIYSVSLTPDVYRHWNVQLFVTDYNILWSGNFRVVSQLAEDIVVAGSGNRIVTITVEDSVSGLPIPDVQVAVYDTGLSQLFSNVATDTSGQVVLSLNDGTYSVVLRKLGSYTFSNPNSLVVSGKTTTAYEGTPFSPSTPLTPDLCVVYGWTLSQQGQPTGGIEVQADVSGDRLFLRTNQQIIRSATAVSSRASDGYWELPLTRSVKYSQANVKYSFTIGGKHLGAVVVPDEDTVGLHELTDQIPCF